MSAGGLHVHIGEPCACAKAPPEATCPLCGAPMPANLTGRIQLCMECEEDMDREDL